MSTFTYDGLGRRVTRTAGGVTTTFHFSGNSITAEKQGGNVVAHYVYGVNRISRDASGSFEYYHNDGQGSTRQLSSDNQSITQTTTYDAFGNVESSTGSSGNAYKYAGQWGYRNDGDDGLMHVGARDYDPLVGRFVTADTWLGEIGRPQSLNRYGYVENDPVNAVDPGGHRKIKPPKPEPIHLPWPKPQPSGLPWPSLPPPKPTPEPPFSVPPGEGIPPRPGGGGRYVSPCVSKIPIVSSRRNPYRAP